MILRQHQDTIVAVATPGSKSALAIVRMTGPDAIRILGSCVADKPALFVARGNSTIYTNIVNRNDDSIDDVVISVFRAPRSFTGEDLIEVSCHGSQVIVSEIVSSLLANGARQALPGEFSERAFFNGKLTLERAELIDAKIAAESKGELRGAERLIQKKFQRLRDIYDSLIALLAKINAQIDFGESDDLSFPELQDDRSAVLAQISDLIARANTRSANAAYLTVALVGPPNVGKSSLFNSLLSYERSIVSDTPGTTRDYLEAFVNIGDFRVKIVDTAGIRQGEGEIESRGIAMGQDVSRSADLVLRLTDPDSRRSEPGKDEVLVHNKADLDRWRDPLAVSARTGAGLPELHRLILSRCEDLFAENSSLALGEHELQLLNAMRSTLASVDLDGDLVMIAEDLRTTILQSSQLLGTNINEDTLNHIFLKMCIGK